MADTKISDLPTDITTLADGDKFPVADASALTADTYATALEIKTYANTAPIFAAGSASAGTWPKLTSGTLLTTPAAGAIEYNDSQLYFNTFANVRAQVPVRQWVYCQSARSLTSTTATQAIFASPNALTLDTGVYIYYGMIFITSMSATSGNGSFDLIGAGSAALGVVYQSVDGVDGAGTAANQTGTWTQSAASPTNMVSATTGTSLFARLNGTFVVATGGTIVPSIGLTTAAAAQVDAGSHFIVERIGSTSLANVGNWS